jgi:hypothetical protein
MYQATVEISHIPLTLNQAIRSHWSTYDRDSKTIFCELLKSLGANRPQTPVKKSHIKIYRYSSGSLDRDNKFFTAKHILDNLVKLQVLENDTEENIASLDVIQVKTKRNEPRKIVIEIKEAA